MILGLLGMPRRIASYPEDFGWDLWNGIATGGAFLIALSVAIFIYNFFWSLKKGEEAGADPWDARTLEWTIPSPPPHYNFREIPQVHSLDDFWHQKYAEDPSGKPVPVPAGAAVATHGEDDDDFDEHSIHMPDPSYMPLIAALGLPLIAVGLLYSYAIVAVGALVLIVGLYGWVYEPSSSSE
jgi:cytochrome c oxidase subunit 1